MIELVLSVSFALVVSAICSLFEAVLYTVPRTHIESLAQMGSASGRLFKEFRKEIDRPIAAILSLNTIAHTAGAALSGAFALAVFGPQWIAVFSVFFTLAILIFSEVIPKTAGVVYSRPLASLIARPLQFLVWFFTPAIWLCQFATRRVSKQGPERGVSEEELILMTRLGLHAGSIEPDEAEVIQNILSLESKKVRSIMTPRTVVFFLSIHLSVEEARKKEGILNYSRIPVYDKDPEDVVGIIHARELFSTQTEDPQKVQLMQLLRPVHFVPDSLSLDILLRQFLGRRQHMFIVIGEFGEWAGVVTLEDVLEEILGREIVDEFDEVVDLRELARQRRDQILGQMGR